MPAVIMRWFCRLTLAAKIHVLVAGVISCALVLAAATTLSVVVVSTRNHSMDRVESLTKAFAVLLSDPVRLNNKVLARDMLAPLATDPAIRAVTLFDSAGDLFVEADFHPENRSASAPPKPAEVAEPGGGTKAVHPHGLTRFEISVPLTAEGESVGSLRLLADLAPVYADLASNVGTVSLIFLSIGGKHPVIPRRDDLTDLLVS